ncbi:MAG: TonB-dependent receptor [bacterium]
MRVRANLRVLFAVVSVVLLAGVARAENGSLKGTVTDESGAAIFAANVAVTSQRDTSARLGRITDASGRFEIDGLAAGPYEVRISAVGYQTYVQRDVEIAGGAPTSLRLVLAAETMAMETLVVTASRRQEKVLDAPASVQVVSGDAVQERPTLTVADHLQGTPGVDIQRAGVNQGTLVVRGFNNIFSGATLTLVDNRIARVPALRYNALNLIPTTNEDIERIEIVSGPGSALYGPNTANGVMHILTRSPLGSEGTQLSLGAGDRNLFLGSGRHAGSWEHKVGWKIAGQAYTARDFQYVDPVEQAALLQFQTANPGVATKIAARDHDAKKIGLEGRVDYLTSDNSKLVINGGFNQADAIELTGLGAVQAKGFQNYYGQARFTYKNWFLQTYMNASDAGDTYNLRTGLDFVDQSRFFAVQGQHQATIGDKHDFIYGADGLFTRPDTKGTINGRNEDKDGIDEIGGYLQYQTDLSRQVELTLAGRVDKHNKLEDPVFSPRAAVVFGPSDRQKFRVTYNRAFSTPTTTNLFLDLVTAQDLGGFSAATMGAFAGYDLRAAGVPEGGFVFQRDSSGGVGGLYMQMPAALRYLNGMSQGSDFLPAEATQSWNAVVQILGANGFDISGLPAPTSAVVGTVLRTLNPTTQQFDLIEASQVQDVQQMKPTITNTFEVGYKGILADRLSASVDVYHSKIEDFVGPLRVETPNVFYDPATLGAYLSTPAFGLSPAQIQGLTAAIASIPVGTVTPQGNEDPADLILTYRNFGNVDLTGFDLGLQLQINSAWSATASYSYVNHDVFENLDGVGDIALNAPQNKGGVGVRYHDPQVGLNTGVRVTMIEGFPVNSGVFVGDVQSYATVDLDGEYTFPQMTGTSLSVSVQNVLDHNHREFVGTPELGRIAIFRLNQRF